jgi:hypothetical protein
MADATGEGNQPLSGSPSIAGSSLSHGARITSAVCSPNRELDNALGLTAMAAAALGDGRRGTNIPSSVWAARRLRGRERCRASRS